ncbi:alpha/beta hydrolase fold domain-containing protein [Litorivivens sp.]|uniref:alpha/beta hydrolase fold domain-containing protein n=1 Tax=Litorivivens sp. TaxID=2020868 RepID=UPI0035628E31
MLILSLFWAWLAWNCYHPWRGKPEIFGVVSFIFGLLVGELPLHIIVIEFLITIGLIAGGGLYGLLDASAVLIAGASWLALAQFYSQADGARTEVLGAARQILGEDFIDAIPPERRRDIPARPELSELINPFAFKVPGVRRVRNVTYHEQDGRPLKLDIFHQENLPPNAPVLLQIHGGAWVIGNKDQQALPLMGQLASRGWVCVTVQYRLSPGATFPDHIIDCKRALVWVKQHIADYGGDPNFIITTGGSAGGHLSALLALSANEPAFQPGFEAEDTRVQGAVPFYGIYDFTNSLSQRRHKGLEELVGKRVLKCMLSEEPERWQQASPLFHVSDQAPTMLLIHGDGDTLAPVEESHALYKALREIRGVRVGFAELPHAQHAFELWYSRRSLQVIYALEYFLTALHQEHLDQQ